MGIPNLDHAREMAHRAQVWRPPPSPNLIAAASTTRCSTQHPRADRTRSDTFLNASANASRSSTTHACSIANLRLLALVEQPISLRFFVCFWSRCKHETAKPHFQTVCRHAGNLSAPPQSTLTHNVQNTTARQAGESGQPPLT